MSYILTEEGDRIELEDATGYVLYEADDTTTLAARVTKAAAREWTDRAQGRNYTDETRGG